MGTLGLAIGATAGIFSVIDTVLLDPLPYADPERLVYIAASAPGSDFPEEFPVAAEFLVQYREHSELLADVASYNSFTNTLRADDRIERVWMSTPTTSLFDTLGVKPVLGRLPVPADESEVMVISHALWATWFGSDPAVLGRVYHAAGDDRTVIGVMGPDFRFPTDDTPAPPLGPQRPRRRPDRPVPLNEGVASQRFTTEDTAGQADAGPLLSYTWSAGDYFPAMGIEVLRGRTFTAEDHVSQLGNVLVSRSAADLLWPGADPLGKRLRMQDQETWETVVGVVDDVLQYDFRRAPEPMVYFPLVGQGGESSRPISSPAHVVKTPRAEEIAPEIRALRAGAAGVEAPWVSVSTSSIIHRTGRPGTRL